MQNNFIICRYCLSTNAIAQKYYIWILKQNQQELIIQLYDTEHPWNSIENYPFIPNDHNALKLTV